MMMCRADDVMFFVVKRYSTAGILGVFQGRIPHLRRKTAVICRRRIIDNRLKIQPASGFRKRRA